MTEDTITITKERYNELIDIERVRGCIDCFKYEVHIAALQIQMTEYADFFEQQVQNEAQSRLVKYPT